MNKKVNFKNKYTFWRFVALCSGLWIYGYFLFEILFVDPAIKQLYLYSLIPITIFMIFSEIHQMRFPLDLRVYIVWIYLFSYLSIAYGYTAVAMLIFFCGCYLGHTFRIFGRKEKSKIIIAMVIFFICSIAQIRLPKAELLESGEEFFISLSALLSMYLINRHLSKRISKDINQEDQKENIEDYFSQNNFTDRDKQMLLEVLSGCKYEEIALNHNLSLSSIKQRLGYLYRKLGVTCQIDFLIKFSAPAK